MQIEGYLVYTRFLFFIYLFYWFHFFLLPSSFRFYLTFPYNCLISPQDEGASCECQVFFYSLFHFFLFLPPSNLSSVKKPHPFLSSRILNSTNLRFCFLEACQGKTSACNFTFHYQQWGFCEWRSQKLKWWCHHLRIKYCCSFLVLYKWAITPH